MSTNAVAVIATCIGMLIVFLNKPLGEEGHRRNVEGGGGEYGVWWYRGTLIVTGLVLVLMSFLYGR